MHTSLDGRHFQRNSRHSGRSAAESRNPGFPRKYWIPASAGMTRGRVQTEMCACRSAFAGATLEFINAQAPTLRPGCAMARVRLKPSTPTCRDHLEHRPRRARARRLPLEAEPAERRGGGIGLRAPGGGIAQEHRDGLRELVGPAIVLEQLGDKASVEEDVHD